MLSTSRLDWQVGLITWDEFWLAVKAAKRPEPLSLPPPTTLPPPPAHLASQVDAVHGERPQPEVADAQPASEPVGEGLTARAAGAELVAPPPAAALVSGLMDGLSTVSAASEAAFARARAEVPAAVSAIGVAAEEWGSQIMRQSHAAVRRASGGLFAPQTNAP